MYVLDVSSVRVELWVCVDVVVGIGCTVVCVNSVCVCVLMLKRENKEEAGK